MFWKRDVSDCESRTAAVVETDAEWCASRHVTILVTAQVTAALRLAWILQ
jgi:hypothetical protein